MTTKKKIQGFTVVIILIILMVLVSGCTTTSCVPVKIDAKYPPINEGGWSTAIIGGKSVDTHTSAYLKLKVNETNLVRFDNKIYGITLDSVCEP